MREKRIETVIRVFDSPETLPASDRELLNRARASLEVAYAPYSGFLVGAAVRLENGQIVPGSNQENAAYPMCLCAERVALAAAAAGFPKVPVRAIAVTARSRRRRLDTPAAPCGACRQVICETEERYGCPIAIILQGATGPVYKLHSGRELLPLAFSGASL